MKKIALTLLLTACISISFAQELKKVAVISIMANKDFTTSWVEASITKAVFEAAGAVETFSTENELDRYKSLLFNDLQKEFPFEFLSEASVLENADYKNFEAAIGNTMGGELVASPGYKQAVKLTDKEVEKLTAIFPEADGFALLVFSFDLQPNTLALNSGMGKANGQATMAMSVFDKQGKKVLKVNNSTLSKKGVKVAMNKVPEKDFEKIPDAIREASDLLFDEIKASLPKDIQKMYKKIN
jgi:hypothetical protein